ncbi:MAG: hypothetical protein KDC14_17240 [Planctomycetes bacterium]|nr:hypothetical protein [Planctomycetota bacterium]
MRFDLPNLHDRPGFKGFEDCVDYAMGSASKKEEGAFLIALSRFLERLVANVAVGRPVSLLGIGTFEVGPMEPPDGPYLDDDDPEQLTPLFVPDGSFQLEVDDPLPADHVTMIGLPRSGTDEDPGFGDE